MSDSGSGTAIRTAILVVILVAVASAFGYEKLFLGNSMKVAQKKLSDLQDDTTKDHPKKDVQEAIGFAPAASTDTTETYRWTSIIGKRRELNVYYGKGKDENELTLKRFDTDELVKPAEKSDAAETVDWSTPPEDPSKRKLFGGAGSSGANAAEIEKRGKERAKKLKEAAAKKAEQEKAKAEGDTKKAEEKDSDSKSEEKAEEKSDEKSEEKAVEKADTKAAKKKDDSATEEKSGDKKDEKSEKEEKESDG